MFVYQSIIIKLFLWFFREFYGIYFVFKNQVFQSQINSARLWRSTVSVDRTRSRSTGVVDRTCTRMCTWPCQLAGRPSGRPTEGNPLSGCPGRPSREPLLSGSGPGRPGGRPEAATVKIRPLAGRPNGQI